jgi:hypothetical protein
MNGDDGFVAPALAPGAGTAGKEEPLMSGTTAVAEDSVEEGARAHVRPWVQAATAVMARPAVMLLRCMRSSVAPIHVYIRVDEADFSLPVVEEILLCHLAVLFDEGLRHGRRELGLLVPGQRHVWIMAKPAPERVRASLALLMGEVHEEQIARDAPRQVLRVLLPEIRRGADVVLDVLATRHIAQGDADLRGSGCADLHEPCITKAVGPDVLVAARFDDGDGDQIVFAGAREEVGRDMEIAAGSLRVVGVFQPVL